MSVSLPLFGVFLLVSSCMMAVRGIIIIIFPYSGSEARPLASVTAARVFLCAALICAVIGLVILI